MILQNEEEHKLGSAAGKHSFGSQWGGRGSGPPLSLHSSLLFSISGSGLSSSPVREGESGGRRETSSL